MAIDRDGGCKRGNAQRRRKIGTDFEVTVPISDRIKVTVRRKRGGRILLDVEEQAEPPQIESETIVIPLEGDGI